MRLLVSCPGGGGGGGGCCGKCGVCARVIVYPIPPGTLPTFPPLPPPLSFSQCVLGDEELCVADVPTSSTTTAPLFLRPAVHQALVHFAREVPVDQTQLLLLTGAVKSGKSSVLSRVLPGLVASLHTNTSSRTPVFFRFTFPLHVGVEGACSALCDAISLFGKSLGLDISLPSDCVAGWALRLIELAKGVARAPRCGCLWILLDEMQAPLAASTREQSLSFLGHFKIVVGETSSIARVAVTGSGMVNLLNEMRVFPPNGFALWDAATPVCLGQVSGGAATREMASSLLRTCSTNRWPQPLLDFVTVDRVVNALDTGDAGVPASFPAHGVTSRRPALIAYLLRLMGDGQVGDAATVYTRAWDAMVRKLWTEMAPDVVSMLCTTGVVSRRILYALVVKRTIPLAADAGVVQTQMQLLRMVAEADDALVPAAIPTLQPPYASLFPAWLSETGELLVKLDHGTLGYSSELSSRLVFFAERRDLPGDLCSSASLAVLGSLCANGIGVVDAASPSGYRPPTSYSEVLSVPALAAVLGSLDMAWQATHGECTISPSTRALRRDGLGDSFGLTVLLWLRHVEAHVFTSNQAIAAHGLTPAVVHSAARAAVEVLLANGFVLDESGIPAWRGVGI